MQNLPYDINHEFTRLDYDANKWNFVFPELKKTLQVFITNRCDRQCQACFFQSYFSNEDMSLKEYIDYIKFYREQGIEKVVLIGGEPTLHKNLLDMIKVNQDYQLSTTIYTNGRDTQMFNNVDLTKVTIRIGVLGLNQSEKPLSKIPVPDYNLFIVYMMRQSNLDELLPTMQYAEEEFNCKDFMFSSIRDIETTGDFWEDTPETIPVWTYKTLVEETIKKYNGNIPNLHISTRGVIEVANQPLSCRFLNLFTDGRKVKCPMDICKHKYTEDDFRQTQWCDKHGCVLNKVILRRK